MKKITLFLLALLSASPAFAQAIYSAHGFVCGKEGTTVTCKGPLPNGQDSVTATGHNVVYITVNTMAAGKPSRYTYFSDSGCMIGYTFNAAGNPSAGVAIHRSGAKQQFDFSDGKFEKVNSFCMGPGVAASK